MKFFSQILIVVLLTFMACSDSEKELAPDEGLGYFPLQTGAYALYNVEEIVFSQLHEPETLAYQLMTEVVDSFANNTGSLTYVFHRSRRTNDEDPWTPVETWSARVQDNEAVVMEGNTAFVKLVFPPEPGRAWNGNLRNNMPDDEFTIIEKDIPLQLNGLTFEDVLTVEQESYDDRVTRTDIRTESYAKGVGLIRKETTQITYCTEQVCLNDEIIESGIIYKQTITEYGTH